MNKFHKFLDLPSELRQRIYTFALSACCQPYSSTSSSSPRRKLLVSNNICRKAFNIVVTIPTPPAYESDGSLNCEIWYEDERKYYRPPALLSTNRQVRSEASKIFYGETEFFVTGRASWLVARKMNNIHAWLMSLQQADRDLVKTVKVSLQERFEAVFFGVGDAMDLIHDLERLHREQGGARVPVFDFSEELKERVEWPVGDESSKEGWRFMKTAEIMEL